MQSRLVTKPSPIQDQKKEPAPGASRRLFNCSSQACPLGRVEAGGWGTHVRWAGWWAHRRAWLDWQSGDACGEKGPRCQLPGAGCLGGGGAWAHVRLAVDSPPCGGLPSQETNALFRFLIAHGVAAYGPLHFLGDFGSFKSTGTGRTVGINYNHYLPPIGGFRSYLGIALDDKQFDVTQFNGVALPGQSVRRSVPLTLGYNARIFDGSFEEWSKKAELPVVVEAEKKS